MDEELSKILKIKKLISYTKILSYLINKADNHKAAGENREAVVLYDACVEISNIEKSERDLEPKEEFTNKIEDNIPFLKSLNERARSKFFYASEELRK